ncbi:hypothetical protein PVA45_07670 (plasmid) [Entomospira entomophila]|uniref:Uncharacterized protein n=1 Tax=Entomospira entomophila TaxID=2719988 RepID=A0A968GDC0_9SPIO|nr:hypothetical protein [Entomospira entomophilus]NIZ41381.1 hypothetical protein [Entomospira entomophilus]WDI36331.1 hypothetical protein PVA45_07670 [Entomospira entomophilus]
MPHVKESLCLITMITGKQVYHKSKHIRLQRLYQLSSIQTLHPQHLIAYQLGSLLREIYRDHRADSDALEHFDVTISTILQQIDQFYIHNMQ